MQIGTTIGGNANGSVLQVSSDPDGTLTAQRGTLAIDTTTGVWWRNIDGASFWWPESIPSRYGSRYFVDFVGNTTPVPYGASAVVATGAITNVAPPAGRQGIVQLSVAAVADACDLRASGNTGIVLGSGKIYYEGAVAIGTSEDGTNRWSTRAGFGDTSAADHVDGVYFESSLAANGSVNWYRCTASNSTRTKTDTSVAVTGSGTYQKLRFRVNALGTQVDFWIDDVSAGSNTTNIPTGTARDTGPSFQTVKTLGATARLVTIDYADIAFLLTAAR